MEQSLQSESNTTLIRRHYYSIDMMRLGLVLCLILARYGVPFFSGYVTPVLNFAPGTLYLFYGYFVLRDGTDLRVNIRHALKVFIIMFALCFALATGYMYVVYGTPFAYLNKRGIFNFAVLNYWGPSMGDYIWYVQSILYSLVLCYLFRKFKKYDTVICIALFLVAFLLGEGARLIHFNILGYTYIPGNFLTRTLPYMLLGRILHRHEWKLKCIRFEIYLIFIAAGFMFSIAEMIGFSSLGILIYCGHLMGFILISFGLAGLMIRHRHFGKKFTKKHPKLFKKVFFLFNPIGEILLLVPALIMTTEEDYVAANAWIGVLTVIFSLALALGWEAAGRKIRLNQAKKAAIQEMRKNHADGQSS